MYYLLKFVNGDVSIVGNCIKAAHKEVILNNYLIANNITYVKNANEATTDGLFCVKCGLDSYRLFKCSTTPDGFVFYGCIYHEYEADLKFVFYMNQHDKMEIISADIHKLLMSDNIHNAKQHKIGTTTSV